MLVPLLPVSTLFSALPVALIALVPVSVRFSTLVADAVLILILSPDAKVQVYGYTDSVGDGQQNLELSGKRVQAVVDYLAYSGVPLDRITSFPRGETNPIGDNNTAAGRLKNQRIELVFTNLFAS